MDLAVAALFVDVINVVEFFPLRRRHVALVVVFHCVESGFRAGRLSWLGASVCARPKRASNIEVSEGRRGVVAAVIDGERIPRPRPPRPIVVPASNDALPGGSVQCRRAELANHE